MNHHGRPWRGQSVKLWIVMSQGSTPGTRRATGPLPGEERGLGRRRSQAEVQVREDHEAEERDEVEQAELVRAREVQRFGQQHGHEARRDVREGHDDEHGGAAQNRGARGRGRPWRRVRVADSEGGSAARRRRRWR